mmetsp:Transcript_8727/g.24971  ORF Transcript_8727/g.24971 Transcript_8727/m.24971 type:complete len:441 (+) Transcript_8727:1-1323(+)
MRRRAERFGGVRGDDVDRAMHVKRTEARREFDMSEGVRSEAIHVFGVDLLNTQQILDVFMEYNPKFIEWLDDSSCNVVFGDNIAPQRAIDNVSIEVPQDAPWRRTELKQVAPTLPPQILHMRPATPLDKKRPGHSGRRSKYYQFEMQHQQHHHRRSADHRRSFSQAASAESSRGRKRDRREKTSAGGMTLVPFRGGRGRGGAHDLDGKMGALSLRKRGPKRRKRLELVPGPGSGKLLENGEGKSAMDVEVDLEEDEEEDESFEDHRAILEGRDATVDTTGQPHDDAQAASADGDVDTSGRSSRRIVLESRSGPTPWAQRGGQSFGVLASASASGTPMRFQRIPEEEEAHMPEGAASGGEGVASIGGAEDSGADADVESEGEKKRILRQAAHGGRPPVLGPLLSSEGEADDKGCKEETGGEEEEEEEANQPFVPRSYMDMC